ncbi:uncharacterized protein LOC144124864 isoform X2 [Amblyomma americanum]
MLNYACCQYVVTRVTLYHSALVDLSRSRSVHAVEHEPCCPDPQFISAHECKAVHYGICSPLLKLPSFAVGPASPSINMAPQPPRPQSATSTATDLSLDGLDPVELLAVDLEGKLEALVNSFVAQDKVRSAARKSKTAMASSQASGAKKLTSSQSSGGAGTSNVVPSYTGKQESKASMKDDLSKKRVKTGDSDAKLSKSNNDKVTSDTAPRKVGTVLVTSGTGVTTKKDVTTRVTSTGKKNPATRIVTTEDGTSNLKTAKSTYNSLENDTAKKKVDKPASKTRSLLTADGREHSPSSDASTDSERTDKSPSPTPGSQRKVFKLSPPSVISLVTGAPKPSTHSPSFSSTYVPTGTPSKSTAASTTENVSVRDSPSPKAATAKDSPKDAVRSSSYPSGPKEPKAKPSQQAHAPVPSESGNAPKERQTVQVTAPSTPKPVVAVKPVSGNRNTTATSSAVDYAKSRFQGLPEPKQFEELFKQKPCRNGHVVNDAKTRWESLTSPSTEQLWPNSGGGKSSAPVAIPGSNSHDLAPDLDSPLSTSPRRLNSPEALFLEASSPPSIPHPRLTSSQKQHIRERSLSPTERTHMHVPVRPFLTKGSVAERVLLFERCPERTSLERAPGAAKGKPTVYSTWKHGSADTHSGSQSQHEKAFVESQTASLKRVVRSSTKQASCIPRFYYPLGKPMTPTQLDAHVVKVKAAFAALRDGRATRTNFAAITRACGVPLYWKMPLFSACGGETRGYVTSDVFIDFWKRIVSGGRDEPTWFVKILSKGTRNYLVPEDFIPMMQDVIDTHPGLTFLKEAVEFHSRYINTVIARIFYCVNRSWSGRITIPELRKSNFLQVLSLLEEEEDINQITEYFSYEHFYVIYCKFWELDKDHDLYIDRYDLSRHNEGAISMRMIDRIFSGAVTRGAVQKEGKMSYSEFVWFIMSEEDKRHPRSIEYWFRCMDIDGDGYLSMYELEYFYEEQLTRMEALGIETLPFSDCLCQMLDMVQPRQKGKVSLADLKRCKMTPIFFDTFFNLEKYLDHEQRDPFASRDHDGDGLEISDWDRYAADEYELLVAEEGNFENHELLYGDYDPDEDELSPNLEKLTAPLRCRTGRQGRLDDDEYDYAESDTDYHY